MGVLRGSNVNPKVFDSPIDRNDIRKDRRKTQREALDRELQTWEALKKTSMYHVLSELASPQIAHLEKILGQSVLDFPGWTLDVVKEYLAECRGELRVWRKIRDTPGLLKLQLDELDKLEQQEQGESGGDGGPDAARKSQLEKYA